MTIAPVEIDRTVDIYARTIFGEARGEGIAGMIAVGWVIRNRVEFRGGAGNWWGEGYVGVCLAPFQFSCWNVGEALGANRKAMDAATLDDPLFAIAIDIALGVMNGQLPDPTFGATQYFADSIPPPVWARSYKQTVRIGHHLFFRSPS